MFAEKFSAEKNLRRKKNPPEKNYGKFFAEKFCPEKSADSWSGHTLFFYGKYFIPRTYFISPQRLLYTAKNILHRREKYLIPRKIFYTAKTLSYPGKYFTSLQKICYTAVFRLVQCTWRLNLLRSCINSSDGGVSQFLLLSQCVSLARRHVCPGQKTFLSWLEDSSVKHFCPGWKTFVFWLADISVLAGRHFCFG